MGRPNHTSRLTFIILLGVLSLFCSSASPGSRQSGLKQLDSPCLLGLSEALCEVPSGSRFQLASAVWFLSHKSWHANRETSSPHSCCLSRGHMMQVWYILRYAVMRRVTLSPTQCLQGRCSWRVSENSGVHIDEACLIRCEM